MTLLKLVLYVTINFNHNLFNILSNSNTTSNANLNLESGLNSSSNTNDDLNLII